MKFIPAILLFLLLEMTNGFSQRVYINPGGIDATVAGPVTIILTDNRTNVSGPSSATVGNVTAIFSVAPGGNGHAAASSVASGTLPAPGNYRVTTTAGPQQWTVILWNEPADGSDGSITLNDLTLIYNSATSEDQTAFQTLIVSLVQHQLDVLQVQITAQQSQIDALNDLVGEQQSAILNLQGTQSAMAGQIDSILSQLALLQTSDGSQNAAIASLQQSQALLQSQYASLQSQLGALQDTVTSQQSAIESLQESMAAMQDQYSHLSDSLNDLQTQVDSTPPPVTSTATTVVRESGTKSDDTLIQAALGLGAAGVIGSVIHFFTESGEDKDISATGVPAFPEGSAK